MKIKEEEGGKKRNMKKKKKNKIKDAEEINKYFRAKHRKFIFIYFKELTT
jgi:hypothetical protein